MKKWLLLLLVGLLLNGCATLQRNDISLEAFCNDVVFEWFPVSVNDWWLYEGYITRTRSGRPKVYLGRIKYIAKVYIKDIIVSEGVLCLHLGGEVSRLGCKASPYASVPPSGPFMDEWITFYENEINFGSSVNLNCVKLPLKDGTSYSCFGGKKWVVSQEQSKNKYLDESFKLQLYRGNKHPVILTRWYKKGIGIVKYTTEEFDESRNKYVVTTEFILKDCSINLLNK